MSGLDLDVRQGETFAFLGPNGAGKCTTIAMLCALARPTSGRATVPASTVLTPHDVRRTGRHPLPAQRPRPGR
ncbi:ATP-binding cassette domain-containing protein [Streptomyces showdoensis]|uniref:ATP-binding cassette domain-containing protein n=1 Tax=Streptomyces showdoensis TaxID=68268 RepID=UPI0031E805FD